MTLRNRVTLAAGAAVLLVVVAVSIAVYMVVRGNLHDRVDDSLIVEAESLRHEEHDLEGHLPESSGDSDHVPLVDDVFMQVVDGDGEIVSSFDERPLPVGPEVIAVASGERDSALFDASVGDRPVRIYAVKAGGGLVLQVGRSLIEVNQTLRQLVITLIAISLAGLILAVIVGRLVAATAIAPVHRVAEAADAVARTKELSHRIAVPGGDDLGRLVGNFNAMLDALSESLTQQRQLVADASHELRTPLATLRTNVEVLTRADELAPDERETLIRDSVAQISELTRLVADLVELARGDGEEEPFSEIDLEEVTRRAVDGLRGAHPLVTFSLNAESTLVRGSPSRVSRAVSNLIDNAAKWSPSPGEIEIDVRDWTVIVRDHGPGIDSADLPHVFDRFYRSTRARTMPGSGLGLAIVKQVADSHGATVVAANRPEGGAVLTLRFPEAAYDQKRAAHRNFSSTS
jgi:two-component system sensor histidine kinase MprB